MPAPIRHAVHRCLHTPLTVCGVDRRVLGVSCLVACVVFAVLGSFVVAVAIGLALGVCAYRAMHHDPQMIQILIVSLGQRARYDAGKPRP